MRLNTELSRELSQWQNLPELLDAIAQSTGASSYAALDAPGAPDVLAYWISPSQQVFTVWLCLPGGIVLHERSVSGETFSLCVRHERVRRIAESTDASAYTLTVEIDADRSTLNLGGGSDEEGNVSLTGAVLHAGYQIRVERSDTAALDRLVRFAVALRHALLA